MGVAKNSWSNDRCGLSCSDAKKDTPMLAAEEQAMVSGQTGAIAEISLRGRCAPA
jgi:hypothetical protein